MTYEELREELKLLRQRMNLGQREVAARANRQQSVICDLERGHIVRPRVDTILWWAKALGYRVTFGLEKIED